MIQAVLAGADGAPLRIVLANAAAALFVAEKAASLIDGVTQAREAIMSGRARQVLETLRRLSAKVDREA